MTSDLKLEDIIREFDGATGSGTSQAAAELIQQAREERDYAIEVRDKHFATARRLRAERDTYIEYYHAEAIELEVMTAERDALEAELAPLCRLRDALESVCAERDSADGPDYACLEHHQDILRLRAALKMP